MTENEYSVQTVLLSDKIFKERAKIHRFMRVLKTYEADLDVECTTTLELCLLDSVKELIKEAHKQFDNTERMY